MNLLRKLLFPFAIVYGWVTTMRNYFYDKGWFKSATYRMPIVCVGNLSVGGTGKSPMVELLLSIFKEDYNIATLSRGYKRKTTGFLEVKPTHIATEVGDEPLQIKQKFPDIIVAVCEDRRTGIEMLQKKAKVILLDDAFQHRKVSPSFNILLTPFHNLFYEDFLLPTGNLRESRKGADRADIIVVTKVPERTPYAKLQEIKFLLKPKSHQKVYFSSIAYSNEIIGHAENMPLDYLKGKYFTLVTGIANPKPLVDFLTEHSLKFEHIKYRDHHNFSETEIQKLKEKELLLTTEKDFMRLNDSLQKYALYYLPIKTKILNEQLPFFEESIKTAIEANLFR
ncbi:tetraacyldisaccharide 4'-kinase [Patiriisocius sp. Uisw_017]|uniref:tetraacyldisaccharide 4'-kinase n=1 Tax=Patiriisocius sp. Uisw_017 TaxID=3230968 RepID=UPI0039E933AD